MNVYKWHCWLRLRRHRPVWRPGLHKLFDYRECAECGRPLLFSLHYIREHIPLVVGLVLLGTTVFAQPPTQYTLRIYLAGATSPLSAPTVIPAASVTCNQAPPTSTITTNPTRAVFDDPDIAGRVCIWTDTGTGPLFSVPFGGTYEATLSVSNLAGESPESTRAPFTRPGTVRTAPAGLRVIR
jgi:hypothetical protein